MFVAVYTSLYRIHIYITLSPKHTPIYIFIRGEYTCIWCIRARIYIYTYMYIRVSIVCEICICICCYTMRLTINSFFFFSHSHSPETKSLKRVTSASATTRWFLLADRSAIRDRNACHRHFWVYLKAPWRKRASRETYTNYHQRYNLSAGMSSFCAGKQSRNIQRGYANYLSLFPNFNQVSRDCTSGVGSLTFFGNSIFTR